MELSIIVPVYRSEECLPELARRVQTALAGQILDYELILVNDASPDRSWPVDAVVVMDDDLQHDPADIPALCEALRGGFDVAYAAFDHKRQALWKNLGSWFNDRVAVVIPRSIPPKTSL